MATLRADFQAFLDLDRVRPPSLTRYCDVITQPGFLAVVIFRCSAVARRAGLRPVARLLVLLNVVLFGAELSPNALIAPGFALVHPNGVVISPGVRLGRGVRVHRGVGFGTVGYDDPNKDGMPTVGDEAVILDGAKVLGPIHVGEHAVVGANAILIRSLPPGAIVAVPSPRVIGYQQNYGPGQGTGESSSA